LSELQVVDLNKVIFTDGTKIEANANRYTFVWRGTVNYHKQNLEAKLQTVLKEIQSQIKIDNKDDNTELFDNQNITEDLINEKIENLNNDIQKSEKLTPKQKV
jgi:hypothetical protein